jgi:two-component system chemotaxis response regulator CheB
VVEDGRDIVVIGGSAGAFDPLKKVIAGLPPGFPASIFVVLHMAPDSAGVLPRILTQLGGLPAVQAAHRARIEPGTIYVARSDHHLVLRAGRMLVQRGPRENGFRPAVDPLFRSAARAYGRRVIGIILSGGLDDGTEGLRMIKASGGVAVVQDPGEAAIDSMPFSAMRLVAPAAARRRTGRGRRCVRGPRRERARARRERAVAGGDGEDGGGAVGAHVPGVRRRALGA